jgi:hypothetical protein
MVRSTLQTVNSEFAYIAANALQLSKHIKTVQKETDENGEQAYQALSQRPPVIAAIQYIISVAAQSAAARILGLQVRIPPGTWMPVYCVLCCHLEVSATGRSLV